MNNQNSPSQFYLWQNDHLNRKNKFWKRFFWLKILINVFFVLFCGIILIYFLRPVLVIDSANSKPISGAAVRFRYTGKYWGSGCSEKKIVNTFSWGGAFFPRLFSPCEIRASKDGYHINSAQSKWLVFKVVKLKKIQNPQALIKFDKNLSFGTCIDILSIINGSGDNLGTVNDTDCDFTFTYLSSHYDEVMINNKPALIENFSPAYKVQVNGVGGIQEVSTDSPSKSYYYYNDLENMFIAPEYGYKKDLNIYKNKAYVLRLRDGKHFIAFHVTNSGYPDKDFNIIGYIQKEESRNLESVGIGSGFDISK